ncbi:transporter [Sphingomonas sp.]|jgi:uncharacterized coiled-coil protein SlyX|uniref:transporter n=1 Tax=Sphingomonas sp. TaxID=28214 RepID=UPI002D80F75E|nr:transporter [Sphingomonas sp.]HEU0044497.1 transporter [Sphingomonas sp.]
MRLCILGGGLALALGLPGVALAQATAAPDSVEALRRDLAEARAALARQEERLRALEARLDAAGPQVAATARLPAINAAQGSASISPGDPSAIQAAPVETVGAAPDFERAPAVAVLGDQGSVITRAGQLTLEAQIEYARADRNRALFRGIELVESVLVGVFDINESRQDVVSGALMARYGLSNRLELGIRAPFVHRNNASVLAPVAGSTPNDAAATRDSSATGDGFGDLEVSARYQLTGSRPGRAFLIGNLQVVAPTGSNPFRVPRDEEGRELRAATGAGFWGVSPSLTAILPTDPAVLFGTIGYTRNFGDDVDTLIGDTRIIYVKPGDSVSASAGIGLSLNDRTSLNIGYAHTWAFGTRIRSMIEDPRPGDDGMREQRARDLQVGRLLFGVTYRLNDRSSLNWSVEAGATDDATDLRTVLRVPLVVLTGG